MFEKVLRSRVKTARGTICSWRLFLLFYSLFLPWNGFLSWYLISRIDWVCIQPTGPLSFMSLMTCSSCRDEVGVGRRRSITECTVSVTWIMKWWRWRCAAPRNLYVTVPFSRWWLCFSCIIWGKQEICVSRLSSTTTLPSLGFRADLQAIQQSSL